MLKKRKEMPGQKSVGFTGAFGTSTLADSSSSSSGTALTLFGGAPGTALVNKNQWDDVKIPEVVRPKKVVIRSQRIPAAIGGDGFESAKNTMRNFEALTSGRDVGKLVQELKN